jgi:hypothetical protein
MCEQTELTSGVSALIYDDLKSHDWCDLDSVSTASIPHPPHHTPCAVAVLKPHDSTHLPVGIQKYANTSLGRFWLDD